MAGGHGGKRTGAGRPKGQTRIPPWKGHPTYKALEEAAQKFSPKVMDIIFHIAQKGKTDTARLAACGIILDLAWGKPRQSHKHQHSVQNEQAITHVDLAGQVDLRRLTNDELRDFEQLLDRATVPATIEAGVIARTGGDKE